MVNIFNSKTDFFLEHPMSPVLKDGLYVVGFVDPGLNQPSKFINNFNFNFELYNSPISEVLTQLDPKTSIRGFEICGERRNRVGLAVLLKLMSLPSTEYINNLLISISEKPQHSGHYEQTNGLWLKNNLGSGDYRTISRINSDFE